MDRKKLHLIAASNHYLRGLLAVPIGMVLIASGLGNAEWGPFAHLWVVPACALLAAALYALLLRYYNDTYGRVRPRMGARGVLGTIVAIVLMGGGPEVVQALGLPLNGIALSWAVVALVYYAATVGLRPHHVAVWGAVLLAALVPLWGDPRTTSTANVALFIVGSAVAVTGVLDHRLLVRTFGSSTDLGLENSNAGG